MNEYGKVCTGFGHSNYYYTNINVILRETLRDLIENHGFMMFYTGGTGYFDSCFASAVRELKKEYPDIKLVLVIPYFSNIYNTEKEFYETAFEAVKYAKNCGKKVLDLY